MRRANSERTRRSTRCEALKGRAATGERRHGAQRRSREGRKPDALLGSVQRRTDNSMAHGDEQPEGTVFWDDNSGNQLGPILAKRAREEEMEQSRIHKVYEKVPLAEATKSGTMLITTRWVDINK